MNNPFNFVLQFLFIKTILQLLPLRIHSHIICHLMMTTIPSLDCSMISQNFEQARPIQSVQYRHQTGPIMFFGNFKPTLDIDTDYRRPEGKQPSLHGRKLNPNPKFLGMAAAYFVCHIGPIFQISLICAFIGCPQSVKKIIGENPKITNFCLTEMLYIRSFKQYLGRL